MRSLGILTRCLGERHQAIVDTLTTLAVLCNRYVHSYRAKQGNPRHIVFTRSLPLSEGNLSEAQTYNQRAVTMYYELTSDRVAADSAASLASAATSSPVLTPTSVVAHSGQATAEGSSESGTAPSTGSFAPSPPAFANCEAAVDDGDDEEDVCDEFKLFFDWDLA